MLKKKIFIFDELNYLLLPLALFLKIFISEVYFVRLIKIWQNEKSIKFLKSIGIRWLNFQDYEIKKTAEISRNVVLLQNQFGDFMDSSNIANDLKGKLLKMGCNANDLKSFALTRVAAHLRKFCEITIFLEHIRKDNKTNFVIVGQFPDFLKEILKRKIKNKALLLNLYSFNILFLFFKIIFNRISFKAKSLLSKKKHNTFDKKIDLKKFKTIFFPHKGIYYGNIYKKDQFYSKKNNSNFYPSNILHLSMADESLNSELTNEFYKKNKIINLDFVSLGDISLKEIIFNGLDFIKKYYFFSKASLGLIIFFLGLWISIKKSVKRLEALPNAKVAIYGYDILSPREVAIACRIKGIKTIATQERFLEAWTEDFFFIFDHYLVINKDVEKHLSNQRLESIKKIKSIGPIRSDLISKFTSEEKINEEKIVLVLDAYSSEDFYGNGRKDFSNWRQNYIFYECVLKLAKENKNIKFIIKGKSYHFINIPYFKNIKNLINQTTNIELHNNKNNSTYALVENIYLTIARYTSFIDDLLFKNRAVIIYETGGYPSTFFNYGENLIVKNYEELKIKFDIWKEDSKQFNENIINESQRYFPFNKSNNKVYDSLHKYLKSEFEYYS